MDYRLGYPLAMRMRAVTGSRGVLVAFLVLGAAAALDLLASPDMEWAEVYLVAVAVMAWAVGWPRGVIFGAVVALIAMAVDVGAIKAVEAPPTPIAALWNAVSEFLVYTGVAIVTDRVRGGYERQHASNRDQARLLQLLEREFLRPLRAVYWFALKFEDTFGPEVTLSDRTAGQLASLRHHVREMNFLATDLLRIGRLQSDELLRFGQEAVDLNQIIAEAVNGVLDHKRVVFSESAEPLIVVADPASLHHAVSSVLGRLLDGAPVHDVVQIFARGSGGDGVVEFASRGDGFAPADFELADLLTTANGGRLVVIPRGPALGVRVNLHVRRTARALPTPLASSSRA
jgi:signal transduction histidine kinase